MKNYTSEYCGETYLQICKDCSRGKSNKFLPSIVLIGLGDHFWQLFSVLFTLLRRCSSSSGDRGWWTVLCPLLPPWPSLLGVLGAGEKTNESWEPAWPRRASRSWMGSLFLWMELSGGALCTWSVRTCLWETAPVQIIRRYICISQEH